MTLHCLATFYSTYEGRCTVQTNDDASDVRDVIGLVLAAKLFRAPITS